VVFVSNPFVLAWSAGNVAFKRVGEIFDCLPSLFDVVPSRVYTLGKLFSIFARTVRHGPAPRAPLRFGRNFCFFFKTRDLP